MEIRNINTGIPSGISGGAKPAAEAVPIVQPGQGVAAPQMTQAVPPVVGKKQVQAMVNNLAESLSKTTAGNLQFSVDDELGKVVVRVIDKETQEVIKQFPSEDAIALAKSLAQFGSLHRTTG
ncbi:MAG: flagellar protein FlaG [Burkholderiaceae bacterium]|jgi:flagellar protein FlaG|nr:flagellar protein FlaG [Burkholderiaceae bacterium]